MKNIPESKGRGEKILNLPLLYLIEFGSSKPEERLALQVTGQLGSEMFQGATNTQTGLVVIA